MHSDGVVASNSSLSEIAIYLLADTRIFEHLTVDAILRVAAVVLAEP